MEAAFAKFDHAKLELEGFRKKNALVVERIDQLRHEVEAAKDKIKAIYLKHKDKLGPEFNGFSVGRRRSINAVKLITLQPELAEFVSYTITVAEFDELVEAGTIQPHVAEQVDTFTESIKAPVL